MHEFDRLYEIISKLRSPDGCPWDQKQTPETLRACLIEECYEAVNAIDQHDIENIIEELGDILLNVLMIARIYEEQNLFHLSDILKYLNEKLIRRHPHVFGMIEAADADTALANWEFEKQKEKTRENRSNGFLLDSVPLSYPPLLRAWKMQQKASKTGFDWPDASGAEEKIREEWQEIKQAFHKEESDESPESECGDFLFAVINWFRHININPVTALNMANDKFYRRFGYVEKKCLSGKNKTASLNEMEKAWNEIKYLEKHNKS